VFITMYIDVDSKFILKIYTLALSAYIEFSSSNTYTYLCNIRKKLFPKGIGLVFLSGIPLILGFKRVFYLY